MVTGVRQSSSGMFGSVRAPGHPLLEVQRRSGVLDIYNQNVVRAEETESWPVCLGTLGA